MGKRVDRTDQRIYAEMLKSVFWVHFVDRDGAPLFVLPVSGLKPGDSVTLPELTLSDV